MMSLYAEIFITLANQFIDTILEERCALMPVIMPLLLP
jgi:hypothetical protein